MRSRRCIGMMEEKMELTGGSRGIRVGPVLMPGSTQLDLKHISPSPYTLHPINSDVEQPLQRTEDRMWCSSPYLKPCLQTYMYSSIPVDVSRCRSCQSGFRRLNILQINGEDSPVSHAVIVLSSMNKVGKQLPERFVVKL